MAPRTPVILPFAPRTPDSAVPRVGDGGAGGPLHEPDLEQALGHLGLHPPAVGIVDPVLRDPLVRLPGDWHASYSRETVKARATDLRRFFNWCEEHGHAPLAGKDALGTIAAEFLVAASGILGPESFKRTGSHLVAFLQGLGVSETVVGHRRRMLIRVRNRAARERQKDRASKPGKCRLSVSELQKIEETVRLTATCVLGRARDLAILVLMRELLLRRGEVENFRLTDWEPDTCHLTIRHAKTDQEGTGVVYELGDKATACLEDWLMVSGLAEIEGCEARASTPIFTPLHKSGQIRRTADGDISPLTGRSVARILSTYAQRAGIEGVSGHTPRRSVARLMHDAGASDEDIQEAGRWSSVDVMRGYVGIAPTRKSAGTFLQALGI